MLKKMAVILLCSALAISVAQADPITVENPSFETLQGLGDQGGWTYEGDVANWFTLGAVSTELVPMANVTDTWYAGVGGVTQTIGYQQLTTPYVAGGQYTLQVAVGRRSDHDALDVSSTHWGIALGYIEIVEEAEVFQSLAEIDGTFMLNGGDAGTFVDQTLTYSTDAAGLGKNIAIGLINHADVFDGTYGGGFSQSSFDNVRLDGAIGTPAIPGDLNSDGFVGGDDLDIVRSFWGQNVTPGNLLQGDPSEDGFVGGDDLDIVRGNWGQGTPPTPAAVPEPGTPWLILTIGLAMLAQRYRK